MGKKSDSYLKSYLRNYEDYFKTVRNKVTQTTTSVFIFPYSITTLSSSLSKTIHPQIGQEEFREWGIVIHASFKLGFPKVVNINPQRSMRLSNGLSLLLILLLVKGVLIKLFSYNK